MEKTNVKKSIIEKLNKRVTKEEILFFLKANVLNIYLIINILYILIGSYLVTIEKMDLGEFSLGYAFFMPANIVIIILLFIFKKYKKDISYLFMLLIAVLSVVSTILAASPKIALYGFRDRYEGLISILYYITIMFLSSYIESKYKKKIIGFILFSGVIQCIYAIFQVNDFLNIYNHYKLSATGFVRNTNFFGTYMILNLNYALGLYIDEKEKIKKYIYVALTTLFMVGLFISNAMSAIVGMIAVFCYILVYCIKNKKIKKIFVIAVITVLSAFLVTYMGKTNIINDFKRTTYEATEIAKGNAEGNFGSGRLYIWRETIKIIPKHLLHGVGIDNFTNAFGDTPLKFSSGKGFVDKAHNEYLQILITAGIFCLILYLALYFIIIKRGIKHSFKKQEIYLILPIIGYIVQAFFNISVIRVAPIFYIALGLCSSEKN